MSIHPAASPAGTCIYCAGDGPFTDEHVFPAGLGGDDRTFLLHDVVCGDCNNAFSRMEAAFMRHSPEGFARIFSQTRGRNRGKKSAAPKFTPESITMAAPEGGDAEVELRAGGQIVLLPQFSLQGNRLNGQAGDTAELNAFAATLQGLVDTPSLEVVTKHGAADETKYAVTTYSWDGACYQIMATRVADKPPKTCIWQDQRPNDTIAGRPHRIFRRPAGQIIMRAGDQDTDGQFLTILRKNRQTITTVVAGASPAPPIQGAPIMMQLAANLSDRERVLAKIGVNLCAFVAGDTFVRQPCFDDIKSGILAAGTPIASREVDLQQMDGGEMLARIFAAAPRNHHFGLLISGPVPGGGFAIGFLIRLYGGAITHVTLTQSSLAPLAQTPAFLLVDYQEHKIRVMESMEFTSSYLFAELRRGTAAD